MRTRIELAKLLVCEQVLELLPQLVRGELGVEDHGRVAGHLATCQSCANVYEETDDLTFMRRDNDLVIPQLTLGRREEDRTTFHSPMADETSFLYRRSRGMNFSGPSRGLNGGNEKIATPGELVLAIDAALTAARDRYREQSIHYRILAETRKFLSYLADISSGDDPSELSGKAAYKAWPGPSEPVSSLAATIGSARWVRLRENRNLYADWRAACFALDKPESMVQAAVNQLEGDLNGFYQCIGHDPTSEDDEE